MSLPTDFGPDSGGRIKGVCIIKPIVYGNIARYFGKKREEDGHTHQWTVYVKPYHNEDMSAYVKKVHFKLHESYANQNRIVVKPPYEISETGWGEFEIVIKIHFHDPNERPVSKPFKIIELIPETYLLPGLEWCYNEAYNSGLKIGDISEPCGTHLPICGKGIIVDPITCFNQGFHLINTSKTVIYDIIMNYYNLNPAK